MKTIFDRDKLLQKMAEKRLNNGQLAAMTGLNRNSINSIVSGKSSPRSTNLAIIALALECKVSDLEKTADE